MKGQDATYGKVTKYQLIDSKAASYEDSTQSATLIFEVGREKAGIYERINLIQPTGQNKFLVKGMFFSENKEGIYTVGT